MCDSWEGVPLRRVSVWVRGASQNIAVEDIVVPVMMFCVRLVVADETRYYPGSVDALAEGVLESLVTQMDLPILLVTPEGAVAGRTPMENRLRLLAEEHLGAISALADKAPWKPFHFAAARAYIEVQHTPESFWEHLVEGEE